MNWNFLRHASRIVGLMATVMAPASSLQAGDSDAPGQVRRAITYLDSRQEAWSKFGSSGRGTNEDRTTCLSCHTGISYALNRPSLGKFVEDPALPELEKKTIADVSRRVEHWAELDSPRFRLMYDFDDRKKVESWGTEAVLDALILCRDDALKGRTELSTTSKTALKHLWETQDLKGDDAGSWDWLNFGLEPWEGEGSRAFGASLAAIAVGSAPGYLGSLGEVEAKGVDRLRDYLRRRFPKESLHNRLWFLEASGHFKDLITSDQKMEILGQVRTAQRDDGGWTLAALGKFARVDGSTQSQASEGYSTGLALHVLRTAGEPANGPEMVKGVAWLRKNQRPDGTWPGISVNKERDPSTFSGKLMTDAATAFSARALVEAEAK